MEKGEMEEIKRHFGVVAEGLRSEVRQVAEGVTNLNEKLDREMTALCHEMKAEFNLELSMKLLPDKSVPFLFKKNQCTGHFVRMGGGQQMFEARLVSQGCVGPDCRDDDPPTASGVKHTKAFVGCEDDPLLLTGDTIDFRILSSELFELLNIQNVMAQAPEQVGGCGRDTLIDQETHAEALSLKSVRAVAESFVDIFRCEMRKPVENVPDRIAVGQVIKD